MWKVAIFVRGVLKTYTLSRTSGQACYPKATILSERGEEDQEEDQEEEEEEEEVTGRRRRGREG